MLETDHLILEYLKDYQLPKLRELICHNEKVMSSTFKGRPFNSSEFESFLQQFSRSEKDKTGFWCVTDKISDELIGFCGLIPCNYLERQDFEFGFVLDDSYWGKGYGTEIGVFSIDYAKNILQLPRILAIAAPNNKASNAILIKLGMKPIKRIQTEERGKRIVYCLTF